MRQSKKFCLTRKLRHRWRKCRSTPSSFFRIHPSWNNRLTSPVSQFGGNRIAQQELRTFPRPRTKPCATRLPPRRRSRTLWTLRRQKSLFVSCVFSGLVDKTFWEHLKDITAALSISGVLYIELFIQQLRYKRLSKKPNKNVVLLSFQIHHHRWYWCVLSICERHVVFRNEDAAEVDINWPGLPWYSF